MGRIGVVITCFNRKQTTLRCLAAVCNQVLPSGLALEIFVVDDDSKDGTALAIRELYPNAKVIAGSGNLFWSGGMRVGMQHAFAAGVQFVLWLNDDTTLYPHAIATLHSTWREEIADPRTRIVVGSTHATDSPRTTYGGLRRVSQFDRLRTALLDPLPSTSRGCDTMNGNCVLIPRSVYCRLDNIHPVFIHAGGDIDYGFRATREGIECRISPGYVGTCDPNLSALQFSDASLGLTDRLKALTSPKVIPLRMWLYLCREHAGLGWLIVFLSPFAKILVTWARHRLWASFRR